MANRYKRRTRKSKQDEYDRKYNGIPLDYYERLSWLYDELNISSKDEEEILYKRNYLISNLFYYDFNVVLNEVPEGTPRPRFRITRGNYGSIAANFPGFVRVYSLTGKEDQVFMKRLIGNDLIQLDSLISTACNIDICTFTETPKNYSKSDKILAEIGLERPLQKPDWDNIEKKYSDMFNSNIWLDDTLVIDGAIHKYYSILPRIEIRIKYLNMVYNKYQYDKILPRLIKETGNENSHIQMPIY